MLQLGWFYPNIILTNNQQPTPMKELIQLILIEVQNRFQNNRMESVIYFPIKTWQIITALEIHLDWNVNRVASIDIAIDADENEYFSIPELYINELNENLK